jgi:hypothetical protein
MYRRIRTGIAGIVVGLAACVGLSACRTPKVSELRPALLADATPATLQTLDRVLFEATRQGPAKRGPGDPTRESVVTALPPPPGPYEGNSPAMPRYFDIVTDGATCYLRDRKTGEAHRLPGVACRPK